MSIMDRAEAVRNNNLRIATTQIFDDLELSLSIQYRCGLIHDQAAEIPHKCAISRHWFKSGGWLVPLDAHTISTINKLSDDQGHLQL